MNETGEWLGGRKQFKSGEIYSNQSYTLSKFWIVRNDPCFHSPYSAYNIKSGNKYKISSTAFIILKLFQKNRLSPERVREFLDKKSIKLDINEIKDFILKFEGNSILTTTKNDISNKIPGRRNNSVNFEVPVTSTPYDSEVHLTNGCNLSCLHCVYDSGKKLPHQLEPNLWINVFDQLESLEIHHLIISGGEPLVYPEAKTLLKYLNNKRIRVELLTNGTLIDKSIIPYLAAPNLSSTVSLDGIDDKTHGLLRGKGSFLSVAKGLKWLSNSKANFHIATTIHKKNSHQLKLLVEYAIELGAKSVNFILLDPLGRAKLHNHLLLDTNDKNNIEITVKQLYDVYSNDIKIGYFDPSVPNYKDLNAVNGSKKIYCTAGTTRMAIRSDGFIFPCVYAFHDNRFAMGTVLSQTIEDIWLSEKWKPFRGGISLNQLNECKSCSMVEFCTLKVCRLRGYYSTGNMFGPPPGCPKIK
ncbi:MAG: radical SAM protein [Candidatus Aminicenantes bacterium]|jgi:radical SAM protein with 4Fe4S-binding SPASM domain